MIRRVPKYRRMPNHIGVIPDGNRRWALEHGLSKERGYEYGVAPGKELCETCLAIGISEITFYGFTHDNTKRPASQREAFQHACVAAVRSIEGKDMDVCVIGNTESQMFPKPLLDYTHVHMAHGGALKVNL